MDLRRALDRGRWTIPPQATAGLRRGIFGRPSPADLPGTLLPPPCALALTFVALVLLAFPASAFPEATPAVPAPWRAVGPVDAGATVALAADPEDGRTLYLATDRGILVSRNAGADWEMTALPGIRALAVHPGHPHHLVLATVSPRQRLQLWRSADRGRTWRPAGEVASPAGAGLTYDLHTLAFDPDDPRTLFVGGAVEAPTAAAAPLLGVAGAPGTTGTLGAAIPRDGLPTGAAAEVAPPPPSRGRTGAPGLREPGVGTGGGDVSFGRLWRSRDGGETLTELAAPDDLPVTGLARSHRGRLHAATARGVFHSDDGGQSWAPAHLGDGMAPGSPGDLREAAGAGDHGGTTTAPRDHGWRPVAGLAFTGSAPETLYAAVGPAPGEASGGDSGLYRSFDGGERWSAVTDHVPPGSVVALALDPRDRRSLYAALAGDGIHGTRGGPWEPLRPPLPDAAEAVALALLGDHLYAATAGGEVYRRGAPAPTCVDDATTLCLDERFRVELEWWTEDGRRGLGQAAPLTGASGWFWIHDPDLPEVVVRTSGPVEAERGVDGTSWVRHAALTEAGLDLRVFDVVTGRFEIHRRPPGGELSADAAGALPFPSAGLGNGSGEVWFAALPEGGCGGDSIDLCLAGGRFEVAVDWRDGTADGGAAEADHGATGAAVADRLSPSSGWFRFFRPADPELFVKLVDGRGVNGHWWLYFGALTEVAFTIRVTDRETGEERLYEVPAGAPMAHGDRRAFDSRRPPG